MVREAWFRNLWKTSQKHKTDGEKPVIGVLAVEIASLMSKLFHLWQCLSDKQVKSLREAILRSVGIKKLVCEDEDYIVRLITAELIDNLRSVTEAVARLGKKCLDPSLRNVDHVFDDLIKFGVDIYGLEYTWKKMERKVKKMQKLVSTNVNLHQESEMLAELEQTLRRMSSSTQSDSKNVFEYQKKVAWKRHEVRNLREHSLWNKAYDDIITLMTRSIFTIFSRIKHVFGLGALGDTQELRDSRFFFSDYIHRSQSVSAALMQASVHPSESSIPGFASGPLGKVTGKSDLLSIADEKYKFYSGQIGTASSKSGPIGRANKGLNSNSGPLVKPSTKSGLISNRSIFGLNLWHFRNKSSTSGEKISHSKSNQLTPTGALTGQKMAGKSYESHETGQLAPGNSVQKNLLNLKGKLFLDAPPETLGAAALALRYANVILVIEKLVASPHLIGNDARDDLYMMLPSSIRASIRARLKPFGKTLALSVYDTALAGEWSEAMTRILEWLAPLAHNTIRWQSERSYEQQNLCNRTNVFLVQTLHFVNQEKAEAIITELLVGLNYVWRFGREVNAEAFLECSGITKFCDYLDE